MRKSRSNINFTAEKDLRKAVSNMAKTINTFKREYGTSSDVFNSFIKDIASSLSGSFNELFDINNRGNYVISKSGAVNDTIKSFAKDIKTTYEHTPASVTEYKKQVQADIESGYSPYSSEYKSITAEAEMQRVPGLSKRQANTSVRLKKLEIINKEIADRAAFISNADSYDTDELYKNMSEAINAGLLGANDFYEIVHHYGRQATYSDIAALASYLSEVDTTPY